MDMMRVKRTVQTRYSILPPSIEKIEKQVREEEEEKLRTEKEADDLVAQGEII